MKIRTKTYKQPVTLGVDAGSKTIGLSASTKKQELYTAEVIMRNDIVDLLSTRREFRRARRSSGNFDIRLLDGTRLNAGVSYKKLIPLSKRKNFLTEEVTRRTPPHV